MIVGGSANTLLKTAKSGGGLPMDSVGWFGAAVPNFAGSVTEGHDPHEWLEKKEKGQNGSSN